jgi:endo-1,4-beta-xylanase
MSKNRLMTRRNVLWLGLGTVASMGAVANSKEMYKNQKIQSLYNPKRNFAVVGEASLKQRALDKKLIYGAAALYKDLSTQTEFATSFAQECGMLVPEWEFKWSAGNALLRPGPDKFDFSATDWMANFAQTHGLLFRGHTLVWGLSLPSWFKETVNPQNAEQFLVNHIKTVVGRYAGRMHSWDVVNEAIEPFDKRADNLRKNPWLEFLGPDYIDLAFRIAAQTDPKAMLVYNDYGLDYDNSKDEARRKGVLKLLENLKSKGTPIHALGIQAHLAGDSTEFNAKKVRNFLKEVANLGLKILITELDVVDKNLPLDVTVRDRIIAGVYEDYLSVALDEPAVIAVVTWGLSDGYTYISEFEPRADGAPVRPLPLDTNLKRKLAWNAIARSLKRTSRRT